VGGVSQPEPRKSQKTKRKHTGGVFKVYEAHCVDGVRSEILSLSERSTQSIQGILERLKKFCKESTGGKKGGENNPLKAKKRTKKWSKTSQKGGAAKPETLLAEEKRIGDGTIVKTGGKKKRPKKEGEKRTVWREQGLDIPQKGILERTALMKVIRDRGVSYSCT